MACPAVHCPVGGLHAVHHRTVLQRQKLSKGRERGGRAERERESIFRSIGLGLEGTLSHPCFPGGLLSRVPSAPIIVYTIVWGWKGKSCRRGKSAPPFARASPCTVWQCLIDPRSNCAAKPEDFGRGKGRGRNVIQRYQGHRIPHQQQ